MERVGVKELRQHASRYLKKVKTGETVEVTDRGKLVALLVPPQPATSARDRMIAAGRLVPGSGPLHLPQRRSLPMSTAEALEEQREER